MKSEFSKNIFEEAIDNVSDQIIITDKNAIILYANKALEKTTGYSIQEVIGTKAGKLWGSVMPKKYYEDMWETINSKKETFISQLQNKKKDGSLYWAEIKISPILSDKNEILNFVGIERDISKIVAVDRMKTEFISLASHQLRTPLSANKWVIEMLLAGDYGKVTKKQKSIFQKLNTTNESMITLVNSLLSVTRLESGRIAVSPLPTNLDEQITSVISVLEHRIKEKNIEISFSIEESVKNVIVDQQLFRQILLNLVTNSVKYVNQNGKIIINITQDNNNYLTSITDNGIGITQVQQNQIFKKFFRADNASKKITDGNGLGLYIVYEMVLALGGNIWFESKENEGTTFWFSLPIKGVDKKEGDLFIDSA